MSRAPVRPTPSVAPQLPPQQQQQQPQSTALTVEQIKQQELSELQASLPAHLQEDTSKDTGLALVQGYIRPPRLKIVQPQSAPEYRDNWFEGTVLTVPSRQVVAAVGHANGRPLLNSDVFYFVPIFMWPEFVTFNPIELKGQVPTIRDRSTDPRGRLATMCRNAATRSTPYIENGSPKVLDGKTLLIRNVECLNVAVMLLYSVDATLWGEPRIMSFRTGEFGVGCKFIEQMKLRGKKMYGCIFQAMTGRRENEKGNWFGYDISNPSLAETNVSPWVQAAEEFQHYQSLHESLAESHKLNAIDISYDDDDGATSDANTVDSTATSAGPRRF